MANFLASIFGTELDKVNCSFYFVSPRPQLSVLHRVVVRCSWNARLLTACLAKR